LTFDVSNDSPAIWNKQMHDIERTKIAQETGVESRYISLAIRDDGSIRMDGADWGPTAEQFWGSDEYEFWVTVPSHAVAKLAFVLLQDKFTGRAEAVSEFRDFCKQHDVEHSFDNWV
jgi:hypothetical protein